MTSIPVVPLLPQREEAAEFFNRTTAGGIITLVSSAFMALLLLSELRECGPVNWGGRRIQRSCGGTAAAAARGLPPAACAAAASHLSPRRLASISAGLLTRVNMVNELSVDTSRGEMMDINVGAGWPLPGRLGAGGRLVPAGGWGPWPANADSTASAGAAVPQPAARPG